MTGNSITLRPLRSIAFFALLLYCFWYCKEREGTQRTQSWLLHIVPTVQVCDATGAE
jgi:hypothetical protein